MKIKLVSVTAAIIALVASVALVVGGPARQARAAELPGMCNGRTDANLVLTAHANGRPSTVPKYILNVSTDANGSPTGAMILGQGPTRLMVSDWCRVWQHQPGQSPGGDCENAYPDGAITAHAVGLTKLDGQTLLVRTDIRKLSDGEMFFRVRYRTWTGEEATAAAETDGCDDAAWTWVPAEEGWYPLDQMSVRTVTSS